MPDNLSRLSPLIVVLWILSACASTSPMSALPVASTNATSPDDPVFLRLYRKEFEPLTCPYDTHQISCGAYLLNTFSSLMKQHTEIEELSISNFSFTCERVGSVVSRQSCTASYRLDFRSNGETLLMNITAQKEKAPLPGLGDKSKPIFKFLRAILDQSVAEFETGIAG